MSLIHEQIIKIMGEVGAIEKNRQGQGLNYSFRGIDDLYFCLQPLLIKHGVFSAPEIMSETRAEKTTRSGSIMTCVTLKVAYHFYASDGSSVTASVIGEAMDTSDKASNKAMSVAHKYALIQVFSIPTKEPKDTDAESPQPYQTPKYETKKAAPKNDGVYRIPLKKFSGKLISEVPMAELIHYATWLKDTAHSKNVDLEPSMKEFIKQVEAANAHK